MNRSRLTSFLPLIAVIALACGTWWLLRSTLLPPGTGAARPQRHIPDYFADNLSISELNQTGTTQYRLTAARLVHYEDDESSDLTVPALRAFQPGKPIITVTAKRGVANSDVSIIDLYDNARIVRVADNSDPQMQADSEHFRALVNEDVIMTKKPVKLQHGRSVVTAENGMRYNNVTRVIDLYGNVRGLIAAEDTAGGSNRQPY